MADLEPPCYHSDDWIGTVMAGEWHDRHCSVTTCAACVLKSQGYVEAVTSLRAKPLVTFQQARAEKRARQMTEKDPK